MEDEKSPDLIDRVNDVARYLVILVGVAGVLLLLLMIVGAAYVAPH